MESTVFFRKCSSCKTPILWKTKYWVCSVSSCNRVGKELVFCKVSCFDAHVPVFNHKSAGAIEKFSRVDSPSIQKNTAPHSNSGKGTIGERRPSPSPIHKEPSEEVLVVVSKVKDFIRSHSGGMNTSESVMRILTQKVKAYCDHGIRSAIQNERKTVLDRDLP